MEGGGAKDIRQPDFRFFRWDSRDFPTPKREERQGREESGGLTRIHGGEGKDQGLGLVGGKDTVGGVAGGLVGGGVVEGGVLLGAGGAVEAPPFGGSEGADGLVFQGAAEGVPGGAETGGGGVEGSGAAEKGGVEGVGGAALGAIRAEVEAANAAVGRERDPKRFAGLGGAEGGPLLVEPLADGEFVCDGVFASAGGVDEPLVGVFDAQLGIGAGLGEEELRGGVRGARTSAEQEEREEGEATVHGRRRVAAENGGVNLFL